MEIEIIDPNLARCKSNSRYGNGERCTYRSVTQANEPTGRILEDGTYLCKPARGVLRLQILQTGEGPESEGIDALIATEQCKGCDMFEPCSNSAIKINGSQNTRQDQPLTNKPCAYSPESKINCTYCDQFRLGDVPSGWELGICNPKRTILRQKISGPLPKLNFVDLQTGLEIADAQQRGCDRYDPQTRSSRIKNPQRSSNNINDLLAEKIEQRLAIAGPREGVFGEIIKDTFQIADLNEGTEVTGMTDIKDIATFLLQTIREATAKLGLRYDDRPFDYAGEIKSFLAKQGFIGPLREISPMLVINNLPNLSAESHTSGTILVQLLIEAGLFSSYQENRVDTYVGSAQVLLSRAARPKIVTKYRHLTQEDGLVQLALMLDQSRATFEAVYKERIRNAVSAGLPGSGKKRGRR